MKTAKEIIKEFGVNCDDELVLATFDEIISTKGEDKARTLISQIVVATERFAEKVANA